MKCCKVRNLCYLIVISFLLGCASEKSQQAEVSELQNENANIDPEVSAANSAIDGEENIAQVDENTGVNAAEEAGGITQQQATKTGQPATSSNLPAAGMQKNNETNTTKNLANINQSQTGNVVASDNSSTPQGEEGSLQNGANKNQNVAAMAEANVQDNANSSEIMMDNSAEVNSAIEEIGGADKNLSTQPPTNAVQKNAASPTPLVNVAAAAKSQNGAGTSPPASSPPGAQLAEKGEDENNSALFYDHEEKILSPTELYPRNALIYWVGYDFQKKNKKLQIRIITEGSPKYEVFQEMNLSKQPELVLRFHQSKLRKRMARDIDATEFLSPVAYVRMRENTEEEYSDVVLTFRESVNPRIFAKDGNVQLTFDLPEHYFAPKGEKKPDAIAQDLSSVIITPQFEAESELPKPKVAQAAPYVPDPGKKDFEGAPADGGTPVNEILKTGSDATDGSESQQLLNNSNSPGVGESDFGASINDQTWPKELALLEAFSVGAVGQFGEEDMVEEVAAPEQNNQLTTQASSDIVGGDGGSPPQQYSGKPILLEFTDAELYLVLQAITTESGYNFVFPDQIGKIRITIKLMNVPWDEALKAILETHGLSMVPVGQNVMRIDSVDNITKLLESLERTAIFKQRKVDTKVLVMRLSHGKSVDIASELDRMLGDSIAKDSRIKITADQRTNTVVVEAPEHVLAKVKNIVERMDLETPQVEIEARIVEVNRNSNNSFGVAWGGLMQYDPGRGLGFGSLTFPNSLSSQFSVDPGVRAVTSAGDMTIKLGSLNKLLDLDLFLKMEERRGVANVLQTNKLVVLDREKAVIVSGSSQFFRPAAGTSSTTGGGGGSAGATPTSGLAEVQFNLSLDVTPEITASGIVNMQLNIKSDTPGDLTGEILANKNTRELTTKMSLKNGDTAVIGGIYDTKTTKNVTGIPFFMDIPLIGFLFRSTKTTEQQMEMLIMVTPKILGRSESSSQNTSIDVPTQTSISQQSQLNVQKTNVAANTEVEASELEEQSDGNNSTAESAESAESELE